MIAAKEFKHLLEMHGVRVTDKLLADLMSVYDTDRNGVISFSEFLRHVMLVQSNELDDEWMQAQETMLEKKGVRGSVPHQVLRLMRDSIAARMSVLAPSKLRSLFRSIDQDNSGTVSIDELEVLLRRFHVKLKPKVG